MCFDFDKFIRQISAKFYDYSKDHLLTRFRRAPTSSKRFFGEISVFWIQNLIINVLKRHCQQYLFCAQNDSNIMNFELLFFKQ